MDKKQHYRTIFISDIHLGNPKNQGDKLVRCLDSMDFENLVVVGDFIDYWQLKGFGKRGEKEQKTLNYINDLSKNGVNITYIQGNHDRKLKCTKEIQIENMTICREIYYKTLKGKTYFVTHGDCIDGVDNNLNDLIGQLGNFIFGGLYKIENLLDKKSSFTEKLENYIKKIINPESKTKEKIENFTKNLTSDGMIIGHFHTTEHYKINGIDYFCIGDWLKHYTVLTEDSKGDLELIKYQDSE